MNKTHKPPKLERDRLWRLASDIAIYAPDGVTLLAENDDNPDADGFCADVAATGLAAGTYYIRVTASPSDPNLTFPYALEVDVE